MFRRRRQTEDLDEDFDPNEADLSDDVEPSGDTEEVGEYGANVVHPSAEPTARASTHEPTAGPFDFKDKPRDDDRPRVDLGGMRVPIPEGVELRVEAQEETIVAAVLVHDQSQIMLNVFAAPKSAGIWAEVRGEIQKALTEGGGSASETPGPFGPELTAQIPVADGAPGELAPARFVGVDGPRWFLRGLITGAAASNPSAAAILEEAFRAVVVNRGADAMAPRDGLALHLPRDIVEGAAQQAADAQAAPEESTPTPEFELKERGPEITETR